MPGPRGGHVAPAEQTGCTVVQRLRIRDHAGQAAGGRAQRTTRTTPTSPSGSSGQRLRGGGGKAVVRVCGAVWSGAGGREGRQKAQGGGAAHVVFRMRAAG